MHKNPQDDKLMIESATQHKMTNWWLRVLHKSLATMLFSMSVKLHETEPLQELSQVVYVHAQKSLRSLETLSNKWWPCPVGTNPSLSQSLRIKHFNRWPRKISGRCTLKASWTYEYGENRKFELRTRRQQSNEPHQTIGKTTTVQLIQ